MTWFCSGGVIRIGGRSSASMGWQETRDAISAALGQPQKTTPVGQGCETHVMPGFAITWKTDVAGWSAGRCGSRSG